MPQIFFIGATGHIGSAVIDGLYSQLPDCSIKALVRNEEKAARLQVRFPQIKTIVGHLDSVNIIERNAKEAGIVINTAPDVTHSSTVTAIKRGLSARPEKGFYIHTSGAASVWNEPDGSKSSDKIWSDVDDIKEILSLPSDRLHVKEDNFVRGTAFSMNIAIVSPTLAYGLSDSPEHPTPITVPDLVATMKVVDAGFVISAGKNILGFIHVKDLAQVYISLALEAAKGTGTNPDVWGAEAYYLVQSEETEFKTFMQWLLPEVKRHGAIKSDEIRSIEIGKALEAVGDRPDMDLTVWSEHVAAMFGTDMRCRSDRASKYLNWAPKHPKLKDTLPEVTDAFFAKGTLRH